MSIPQSDLIWELEETLSDRLYDEGYPEYEVYLESRPSEFLPPGRSKSEFTNLSFVADLIVAKTVNWVPQELDSIQNLERWFPTDSIKVPVAVMQVEHKVGFDDIKNSDFNFSNLRLWKVSQEYDGLLGILINFDSTNNSESVEESPPSGTTRIGMSTSSRRGDFILQVTSNVDQDWLEDSITLPILRHIESLDDETLIESYSLNNIVEDLDTGIFHFNEVLSAYRSSRNKILIVLLSVFFESYVNELIADHVSELKDNEVATDFYKDWDFHTSLNACRFFGIIEEREYDLINKVRDARNTYAHEFEDYHVRQETQLEQEGRIDEAVQLYENLIGVKDSMVE